MKLASTITSDAVPPEVLEQLGNPEPEDFGFVDTDGNGLPGGLGFVFDSFGVIFGIVTLLILAAGVFMAFLYVRNYKASKNAGLDPFTLQTELAVRAANSEMLAPKKTIEEKLRELDDLLARGLITRDEYTQARLKALGE
ncbi:SHOCT domain-containing protein [Paeniglutamicibacter sp. R2-26]|uniref:SHOCT domain-containing protein n=1 Tax=Paeniglutamicibacter sp. R2-26 TaxID=3144417 RepID=UPI003EE5B7CC